MTNEEHTNHIEKLFAEISMSANNLREYKLINLAREIDAVNNKIEVLSHIIKERKEIKDSKEAS
jgi:hypothetical protein